MLNPWGMQIVQVEPGTVIKRGDTELTVTDTQAVYSANTIYLTPTAYERLKSHPDGEPRND